MWSFWNKERKKNTLAPAMLDARVEFFRFLRAGFDGLHSWSNISTTSATAGSLSV